MRDADSYSSCAIDEAIFASFLVHRGLFTTRVVLALAIATNTMVFSVIDPAEFFRSVI